MTRTYRTPSGQYWRRDPETGRASRISEARGKANLARSEAVKQYWGQVRGDRARARDVAEAMVPKGTGFRVLFRKATGYRVGEDDPESPKYPKKSRLGRARQEISEREILEEAAGRFGPHFIPVRVLYAEETES